MTVEAGPTGMGDAVGSSSRLRGVVGRAAGLVERLARGLTRRLGRAPTGAIVAVAIVLGLGARIIAATTLAPSVHEAHYLRDARSVLEQGGVHALHGSVHGWLPALAYARILATWPLATERELRWVQLACSALAMATTWAIGRAALGPRPAAAALLVHALTPSAIFYGASMEPYAAHLVLVTAMTAAYVASVRRSSVPRALLVALVTAAAALHHLVAAVNAAALAGHAVLGGRPSRAQRLTRALPLAAGVAAALPMALGGSPGHARHWLGAEIPYFFSVAVVGSIVVFAVLYDEVADSIEPAWREVLPWWYVAPVLMWLPYCRLQYLLPTTVPMALVLGAALTSGVRPRLVGAVLVFVALGAASTLLGWLQGLSA